MAARLGQSAANAKMQIMGMGQAANAAEAGVNRMAATQARLAGAFDRSARSVANAKRANDLYFQSANRIEKQQIAMLERHQARQGLINAGLLPSGAGGLTMRQQGMHQMMTGMVGFGIAMGLQTGFSKWLDTANVQTMARTKMGMVGYKGDLLAQADARASELSRKYKNVSKGDILEQMYEGVAIYGDAGHALQYVETQTRLASFLQGFQGGAHGHRSKEWQREVFAAIKSMEMYGILNEHDEVKKAKDIEDYAGSMMAMKALYGDQAKISEYLTTQRRSGMSFYRFGENFRLNVLPALVQEAGGATTGQQAMTAYQTIAGGTILRKGTQIPMLRKYGLYDKKTGRFKQDFIDKFVDDPTVAAADLIERAEKLYGKNDPKLIDKLLSDLGKMAPNRNMAQFFANMIRNKDNIHKHIEAMKLARKELEAIAKGEFFAAKTKAGADGSVSSQWQNLMASLGGPMVEPYIARMNKFAGTLNWLSESANKLFRGKDGNATGAGKAFGEAGMIGLMGLGGIAALAAGGFLIGGLRMGLGMLPGMGLLGGAARAAMPVALGVGGGAAGGLAAAAAGGAAVVAVSNVGKMARAFGGLATMVGVAGHGIHTFHRVVNRYGVGHEFEKLMGPMARLTGYLKTTLWGYGLTQAGMWGWRNRDWLMQTGQEAYQAGRSTFVYSSFSEEAQKALNKLFGDMPALDFSSVQAAVDSIGKSMLGFAKDLGPIMAFIGHQLGLSGYADRYGKNGENIPSWYSEEERRKVMARIRAENAARPPDYVVPGSDGGVVFRNMKPGFNPSAPSAPMMLPGFSAAAQGMIDAGAAPKGEGMREIAVRTFVDITQSTPLSGSVTVKVDASGMKTESANVTGAVQGKSNASRGESAPSVPNFAGGMGK